MTDDELKLIQKHWYKIPVSLRRRWWDETDYNSKLPGKDLLDEVLRWIADNRGETP